MYFESSKVDILDSVFQNSSQGLSCIDSELIISNSSFSHLGTFDYNGGALNVLSS